MSRSLGRITPHHRDDLLYKKCPTLGQEKLSNGGGGVEYWWNILRVWTSKFACYRKVHEPTLLLFDCLESRAKKKQKTKQQEGLDEEEQHACEHFQRKLFLYTFWLVNFDWTFLLYNPHFSFSSVTIDCAGPWLTEHLMLMLLKRYCRWKIKLISASYSGTPL